MAALPGFLTRNWPLKLSALVLASILWVLVASEETTSQLVDVRVELDLPPTLALARPSPTVRALVTGPARELIKLYTAPAAVRAVVPAGTPPTTWRLGLEPPDIIVPRQVKVTVQDVEPRSLQLELDRLQEREVPVSLQGTVEAESGFAVAGQPVLAPARVRVSGPATLVRSLQFVPTEIVEVRGVTGPFERTVRLDTAAHPMLRYQPREVTVSGRARRN